MIYKFSQIPPEHRTSYKKSLDECAKKVIHIGQLKLFFAELIFLSIHAKHGDLVLYIGAAPGTHIGMLAELYPDIKFHLWDPRKFNPDLKGKSNIKIYQQYFTDTSAEAYAQDKINRILVMCDIRDLDIGQFKRTGDIEGMDKLVDDDMSMQKRWCQIIQPAFAYLKFRLGYNVTKTEYLTGTIYLQPYSKVSTETRLMTNDYETEILYDNLDFEEKLAYHNAFTRCSGKAFNKYNDIFVKYNLKNCWDNALAMHITALYLKSKLLKPTNEEIGVLFMNIIKYHIDKESAKKYAILFN
jgi:hypothetical protein